MTQPTAPEPDHELVMPFVVVATKGGPYDDDAFTAGWEAGAIDAVLQAAAGFAPTIVRWVRTALVPQLDLIAMRHEYRFAVGRADESGEWTLVTFGRAEDDEDEAQQ